MRCLSVKTTSLNTGLPSTRACWLSSCSAVEIGKHFGRGAWFTAGVNKDTHSEGRTHQLSTLIHGTGLNHQSVVTCQYINLRNVHAHQNLLSCSYVYFVFFFAGVLATSKTAWGYTPLGWESDFNIDNGITTTIIRIFSLKDRCRCPNTYLYE